MEQKKSPEWLRSRDTVDEVAFAREYLSNKDLICVDGAFFSKYGRVADENVLKKEIYLFLSPYIKTGIPRKIDRILEVMRLETYRAGLAMEEDDERRCALLAGLRAHVAATYILLRAVAWGIVVTYVLVARVFVEFQPLGEWLYVCSHGSEAAVDVVQSYACLVQLDALV